MLLLVLSEVSHQSIDSSPPGTGQYGCPVAKPRGVRRCSEGPRPARPIPAPLPEFHRIIIKIGPPASIAQNRCRREEDQVIRPPAPKAAVAWSPSPDSDVPGTPPAHRKILTKSLTAAKISANRQSQLSLRWAVSRIKAETLQLPFQGWIRSFGDVDDIPKSIHHRVSSYADLLREHLPPTGSLGRGGGGKCKSPRLLVTEIHLSSGVRLYLSPVRSPASTCPVGFPYNWGQAAAMLCWYPRGLSTRRIFLGHRLPDQSAPHR